MTRTLRARATSRDTVNAAAIVIGGNVHVCLLLFVERCLSLTRGIDIEHREVHGDFVRLSHSIGASGGHLALAHPDHLVFRRGAQRAGNLALQNDGLVNRGDALVQETDLAHHLGELGLHLLCALGGAGDLLLHPDNAKGTANRDGSHGKDEGDATGPGL